MNDFKILSRAEKLAEIGKCNFRRGEFVLVEEYMLALADDNRAVIEEYESFGDRPRQIIENKAKYEKGLSVYGFTEKRFRKYGWLSEAEFLDREEIVFGVNGRVRGINSVQLGRGPNGKWTYGIHLTTAKSGRVSGLSVYGQPFASRNGCLKNALDYFIQWHERENDKQSGPALREAKDMLDTLTGRKAVQMSLFG
ncbi:MAG: hypothetical protein LBD42_04135 [Desulfovibrio sp.]|jgi:hypothetical protein|nr:hypothetical protein [Desulfovibrio sp.]